MVIVGLAILVILASKASSRWEGNKFFWNYRALPYLVYMYFYLWHMLCLHLSISPLCPCFPVCRNKLPHKHCVMFQNVSSPNFEGGSC